MALVRQGFYTRSGGRNDVTAVKGSFEKCKVDEALIGPYGPALPGVTGAQEGQEFWDSVTETFYKFNGSVWIPIGGGGAATSQWTAHMVSQPGSQAEYNAQYTDIQAAINAAAAVATAAHPRMVLIAPEVFNENITILPNVHLRGAASSRGATPVIVGQVSIAGSYLGAAPVDLHGITFRSNGIASPVLVNAQSVTVNMRNCRMDGGGVTLLELAATSGAGIVFAEDCDLLAPVDETFSVAAGCQTELAFNRCQIIGPFRILDSNIGFFAETCLIDEFNNATCLGDVIVKNSEFKGVAYAINGNHVEMEGCKGSLTVACNSCIISDCGFSSCDLIFNTGAHVLDRVTFRDIVVTGDNSTTVTVSSSSGRNILVRGETFFRDTTLNNFNLVEGDFVFERCTLAQNTYSSIAPQEINAYYRWCRVNSPLAIDRGQSRFEACSLTGVEISNADGPVTQVTFESSTVEDSFKSENNTQTSARNTTFSTVEIAGDNNVSRFDSCKFLSQFVASMPGAVATDILRVHNCNFIAGSITLLNTGSAGVYFDNTSFEDNEVSYIANGAGGQFWMRGCSVRSINFGNPVNFDVFPAGTFADVRFLNNSFSYLDTAGAPIGDWAVTNAPITVTSAGNVIDANFPAPNVTMTNSIVVT